MQHLQIFVYIVVLGGVTVDRENRTITIIPNKTLFALGNTNNESYYNNIDFYFENSTEKVTSIIINYCSTKSDASNGRGTVTVTDSNDNSYNAVHVIFTEANKTESDGGYLDLTQFKYIFGEDSYQLNTEQNINLCGQILKVPGRWDTIDASTKTFSGFFNISSNSDAANPSINQFIKITYLKSNIDGKYYIKNIEQKQSDGAFAALTFKASAPFDAGNIVFNCVNGSGNFSDTIVINRDLGTGYAYVYYTDPDTTPITTGSGSNLHMAENTTAPISLTQTFAGLAMTQSLNDYTIDATTYEDGANVLSVAVTDSSVITVKSAKDYPISIDNLTLNAATSNYTGNIAVPNVTIEANAQLLVEDGIIVTASNAFTIKDGAKLTIRNVSKNPSVVKTLNLVVPSDGYQLTTKTEYLVLYDVEAATASINLDNSVVTYTVMGSSIVYPEQSKILTPLQINENIASVSDSLKTVSDVNFTIFAKLQDAIASLQSRVSAVESTLSTVAGDVTTVKSQAIANDVYDHYSGVETITPANFDDVVKGADSCKLSGVDFLVYYVNGKKYYVYLATSDFTEFYQLFVASAVTKISSTNLTYISSFTASAETGKEIQNATINTTTDTNFNKIAQQLIGKRYQFANNAVPIPIRLSTMKQEISYKSIIIKVAVAGTECIVLGNGYVLIDKVMDAEKIMYKNVA